VNQDKICVQPILAYYNLARFYRCPADYPVLLYVDVDIGFYEN